MLMKKKARKRPKRSAFRNVMITSQNTKHAFRARFRLHSVQLLNPASKGCAIRGQKPLRPKQARTDWQQAVKPLWIRQKLRCHHSDANGNFDLNGKYFGIG